MKTYKVLLPKTEMSKEIKIRILPGFPRRSLKEL